MQFKEYIKKVSPKKVALLMGVSETQVSNYKRLKEVPRPAQARKIVKATKGAVDYADIYEPYFKAKEKAKCQAQR